MLYWLLASALIKVSVSLEETLKHVLITYLPSLFESKEQLLAAKKALLAKSIGEKNRNGSNQVTDRLNNLTINMVQTFNIL